MHLKQQLIALFDQAARLAFPGFSLPPAEVVMTNQPQHGHYQYNSAMRLSKLLKKPPREVAECLITHLPQNPWIVRQEIAGPGFINLWLSSDQMAYQIQKLLEQPHLGIALAHPPQKMIVDFSSPNTAKEMHVGHLRSTIIGDCLARVFTYLGHQVLRLNHVGDWGTAFGMLLAHLKETHPQILVGKEPTNLSHLANWYKESKKRFDEDPEFKRRAQQEVVLLQSGDASSLSGWHLICDISRRAYQEIYHLLDVEIEERGESFYNPLLPKIVQELAQKGLLVDSDGAKCCFVEGFTSKEGTPLPLILQKTDGGYTYDTTDMAALWHRISQEKADRIVYVVDAGQSTHFQMLFQVAEKAGLVDCKKTRLDHVPFGLVLGPDGKKFRTRSGETEKLLDLLQAAVEKALCMVRERNPTMALDEAQKLAHALGIGAVKYADLSCNRVHDYTFSYDRMLRFDGNTAAFLLYSYVRIQSIQRKSRWNVEEWVGKESIALLHPSEENLALSVLRFEETLATVAEELLPNRLTDYLYTLAESFNAFFRDCRVEGSPEEKSRLLLIEATARTLQAGLSLLGIATVERM